MSNEDLQKLQEIGADFNRWRELEADGNGQNLHDIKVTFDYVKKTLQDYNIAGTVYGAELLEKATQASNILSELWQIFQDLEISINNFYERQSRDNNGNLV